VGNALDAAKAGGIVNEVDLALVEAEAYPHFLHICAILFLLNAGIMLVIGKIWPSPQPYVQEYTKKVAIEPWKYVKPVGLIICLVVIGIYIYFA